MSEIILSVVEVSEWSKNRAGLKAEQSDDFLK